MALLISISYQLVSLLIVQELSLKKMYNLIMKDYSSYISIDPEIRFGKPCLKGTRIAVVDILQWLAFGMTDTEILNDYPSLKKEHILAALAFAANRESIIKIIAA
jgi:uncharacterized protein (DUF433 family)